MSSISSKDSRSFDTISRYRSEWEKFTTVTETSCYCYLSVDVLHQKTRIEYTITNKAVCLVNERNTYLCAWQQNSHRLTQQSSQRLSAPPSPHRSHPSGPSDTRLSRNTSSRARWSVLKPSGPDGGRSTSESQSGHSTVTEGRSSPGGARAARRPMCEGDTEKGSSCPMQSEQKVCKHGRILGSRYSRLQALQTALGFAETPFRFTLDFLPLLSPPSSFSDFDMLLFLDLTSARRNKSRHRGSSLEAHRH